jgi:allantoate deiminase
VTDLDSLTNGVLQRCDQLAECSEEPGRLTRTFLQPPMKRVHELLHNWMRDAGLVVRTDAIGNLIGRKVGRSSHVFVVGSHVDTVPDAGKYDGVLGVMLGIAAAEALATQTFRSSLDVIAFSEEEGVRFRAPYLGSRAVCGSFNLDLLKLTDADGVTMADAVREFGLDPLAIPSAAYPPGQLVGYLEAHIEQGPVLESLNASLGVVSGIAGQSRFWLRFNGQASHAGTQPMELRRDALAAAAEFVTIVERAARQTGGLRSTVGSLTVSPGATNVVPAMTRLSLDVRHADDQVRQRVVERLMTEARSIGDRRRIAVEVEQVLDEAAVACDDGMTRRLTTAAMGCQPHLLISGAGHDAVVMATRCPAAMLFMRSPGAISHHPDETVRREDVRAALEVMIRFLKIELDQE